VLFQGNIPELIKKNYIFFLNQKLVLPCLITRTTDKKNYEYNETSLNRSALRQKLASLEGWPVL
jgi:hypothetical protein